MTGSIDRAAGLTIATSQFAVTGCPEGNARTVRDNIERAAARGADVVLFPEAALTGYPGVDFSSFRDFRWDLLRAEFERVRESAVTHDCWVIVGSAHPLDREHAPTNCVYVIAPTGAIETRYDKRRLYGQEVDHYSVGEGATTFTIGGIPAGVLICYDSCFPELYAELESGVKGCNEPRGVRNALGVKDLEDVHFGMCGNSRTRGMCTRCDATHHRSVPAWRIPGITVVSEVSNRAHV